MIKIGDIIQDQEVILHDGTSTRLKTLSNGKSLVIYFYPKDFTPGCTNEACSIRDEYAQILSKANIVGVSSDSVQSHEKFIKKFSLPFPLISDPEFQLTKTFGSYGNKPRGGVGLIRSTFILDNNLTIKKIFGLEGFPKVTTQSHGKEILEELVKP